MKFIYRTKHKNFGIDNFEINKDYSVAIFSLNGDKESEKFREIFYSFSCSSWKIKIIDFGRLKNGFSETDTKFAIEQIINRLSAFGILVICVGGNSALTNTVYDAINDNIDYLNIVSVISTLALMMIKIQSIIIIICLI